MTGPYRMSHPKPNDDVEPVPGDPAVPEAQPVPRQPSPEDDPVDDEDPEGEDGKA